MLPVESIEENIEYQPEQLKFNNFKQYEELLILKNLLNEEEGILLAQEHDQNGLRKQIFNELHVLIKGFKIVNVGLVINAFQMVDRVIYLSEGKINEAVLIAFSCYILSCGAYHDQKISFKDYLNNANIRLGKQYTSYDLRSNVLQIAKLLNFRLMNVNIHHLFMQIISIDRGNWEAYYAMKSLATGGSFIDISFSYFTRKWLLCVAYPAFASLPPSFQLVGLLKSFGTLSENAIQLLGRTGHEITVASQIVYAALHFGNDTLSRLPVTRIIPIENYDLTITFPKRDYQNRIHEITSEGFYNRFKNFYSIDKGMYGEIYRAHDQVTEEQVVLKIIKIDDLLHVAEWIGEVCYAAYLNNIKGLVEYKEVFYMKPLDPASPNIAICIVMPCYLSNARETPRSMITPRFNLKKVLNGLRELHVRGFTHGDIKPENILVNDIDDCCLADFGMLRRHPSGSGRLNSYTPCFFCPKYSEKFRSCSVYDLFALVMTLISQFQLTRSEWIRKVRTRVVERFRYVDDPDILSRVDLNHIAQATLDEAIKFIHNRNFWNSHQRVATILSRMIEVSNRDPEFATATCSEWLSYLD